MVKCFVWDDARCLQLTHLQCSFHKKVSFYFKAIKTPLCAPSHQPVFALILQIVVAAHVSCIFVSICSGFYLSLSFYSLSLYETQFDLLKMLIFFASLLSCTLYSLNICHASARFNVNRNPVIWSFLHAKDSLSKIILQESSFRNLYVYQQLKLFVL